MRVKFYRGPWHGKVRDIDPGQLRGDTLVINLFKGVLRPIDFTDQQQPVASYPNIITCQYRIKMMGVTLNGQSYRAPAMHPDGSLFLEYVR